VDILERYKVDVPEGVIGNWEVEKFEVTREESDADRIQSAFSFGGRGRFCRPGSYTRLMKGGEIVMSDTFDEVRDHLGAIQRASGRCLVNGLGLGVVLNGMLMKDEVEHVTAVELSEEVIQLVGKYYEGKYGDRLKIVHANAMDWKPPKNARYSVVWHDIWQYICTDNLPDMHHLHRKYGRRCDWQGSWCRELLERESRRNYY